MSDSEIGWGFLVTKRWFGYYALIVVFAVICVLLGNWQFDRRAEAQAEIARIDSNYDAPPTPITELLPSHDYYDEDTNKWRPVSLTGTYVGDPFLARNRPSQQGVGSLLIHPFQLRDGSIFLVDRGWVNVSAIDGVPETLPMPHSGELDIVVRLRQSEEPVAGREDAGRTLGSLHLPNFMERFHDPVYTGAYGQIVSETPAGETGLLPTRPERDEGPHLSYALQWYVFILIALGGAWYAARLEYRGLNPEAAEAKRIAKEQAAKKPKRLSDAEEEDAYLDGTLQSHP